jgi:molecular chaperone GrpE
VCSANREKGEKARAPRKGFSAPLFMKNHQQSPKERASSNQCSCQDCSCQSKEKETKAPTGQEDVSSLGLETNRQTETQPLGEEGEPGEAMAEEPENGAETLDPETLQAEVLRLEQEKDELNQKLIRLQADFDNYRRRNRKELQEGIIRANEELIGGLLPVLDNLDRALAVEGDASGDSIRDGVELVYRQFLDILGKEGLEPIKAMGEIFDPNIHEAAMVEMVDEPELENRIIQELQKGYSFHERVLRAAVVKVAKVKD